MTRKNIEFHPTKLDEKNAMQSTATDKSPYYVGKRIHTDKSGILISQIQWTTLFTIAI